jgi:kynurenine formamidase
MIKYIDLSQDIIDNMPVHPYDDKVKLYQDKYLDKDEYNNFKLEIGMHAGTHIDSPMHLTNNKTYINEITLESFIGKGCLLDVRGEKIISFKDEYASSVVENDIVILFTDYSKKYGTEDYYTNHPVISEALADFFIDKKIKMLGIDLPSPDRYPFEIHKKLFNNNILIIENLTNLSELIGYESIQIIALPLKIKAEASMARVIAIVDN